MGVSSRLRSSKKSRRSEILSLSLFLEAPVSQKSRMCPNVRSEALRHRKTKILAQHVRRFSIDCVIWLVFLVFLALQTAFLKRIEADDI